MSPLVTPGKAQSFHQALKHEVEGLTFSELISKLEAACVCAGSAHISQHQGDTSVETVTIEIPKETLRYMLLLNVAAPKLLAFGKVAATFEGSAQWKAEEARQRDLRLQMARLGES